MKCGYLYITGVLFFTSCFQTGMAQTKMIFTNRNNMTISKEEQLAKQIFSAFQKKDEQLWQSLYPTNEEYRELLQLMLKEKMDGLTQGKIDSMLVQREEEAIGVYKLEFEDFLVQADSLGVNWLDAQYSEFDFLPYLPTHFPRKYLDGNIFFLSRKKLFVIQGIEAVEISSGFKLQSIKRIIAGQKNTAAK